MLYELKADFYDRVAPLFQGSHHNLSVPALLAGNNPGRIYVDDPEQPHAAFALTVEGAVLAGDHTDPNLLESLSDFFAQLFEGEITENFDRMWLDLHPADWEAALPELIPTHKADKMPRYFYLCQEVRVDWRAHLPDGYRVRRTDSELLNDPEIEVPQHLKNWIEESWGKVERLEAEGAGFCVLYEDAVVCWCTADCVAGKRIDIGIRTAPEHRRRGLATVAVAATVEDCLGRGFHKVGWHCDQDNFASWKTAEKVGFERSGEYFYYYYIIDQVDHLAQLGWSAYKRDEYDVTARYYDSVFALREDNPDYYYHLAAAAWSALGVPNRALEYLETAVDCGWSDFEMTERMDEFNALHDTPRWQTLLSRMREEGS